MKDIFDIYEEIENMKDMRRYTVRRKGVSDLCSRISKPYTE